MEKTRKSFLLGYSLIINSILAFWFSAALSSSAQNVWIPAFIAKFGWSRPAMLTFTTIGGLIAVVASIFFAQIVMKRGTRWISVICYWATGILLIMFGRIQHLWQYAVIAICINVLTCGYGNVTTNTLIGRWFPKKKAVVLGITTMGMPMAAALFVPMLNKLNSSFGITTALTCVGVGIIILGFICIFWIKEYPQDVGLWPDNIKPETTEVQVKPVQQRGKSQWTAKRLLCNKNAWLIALAYGILFLATTAMVGNTVAYLVEYGIAQKNAVTYLSWCSMFGIFGSFCWGVLDQKVSTKTASLIYAGWYVVTFALLAFRSNNVVLFIGLALFGFALGGIGNLQPSMTMTVFGSAEFPSVNRTIYPIVRLVQALGNSVIALGLVLFGNYKLSVLLLAILTAISFVMILFIKPESQESV